MKKVTGIGGIFFKCTDPKHMKQWYAEHLGITDNGYGASFEWLEADDSGKKGSTTWSPFPADTKYFQPSVKDFMINYRVTDLEQIVADMKASGVIIVDEIATYDYGKFVHVLDPEGNKIELWEPIEKK